MIDQIILQKLITNKILNDSECFKVTEDFLKEAHQKLGVNDCYRHLYDKTGKPIRNITSFGTFNFTI